MANKNKDPFDSSFNSSYPASSGNCGYYDMDIDPEYYCFTCEEAMTCPVYDCEDVLLENKVSKYDDDEL